MAFFEVQFPQQIAYGSSGGPGWLTRIVSTQAGYEYRSQVWPRQRGTWNVAHGLKLPSDFITLRNFFNAVGGRANSWRFRDWLDFVDEGVGTIQLNPAGQLQLAKTYSSPLAIVAGQPQATYTRFISKPVPTGFSVPLGVTVDYTTGICTGSATVGMVWSGTFDVPCRFDIDNMDSAIEQPSGTSGAAVVASWKHIPIVEVRIKPGASSG